LGSGHLAGGEISSLTDYVILLRYVEVKDHLERAVLALKARGSAHDSAIRHFSIDASGPHVGGLLARCAARSVHQASRLSFGTPTAPCTWDLTEGVHASAAQLASTDPLRRSHSQ
jgi:hypothetical protein